MADMRDFPNSRPPDAPRHRHQRRGLPLSPTQESQATPAQALEFQDPPARDPEGWFHRRNFWNCIIKELLCQCRDKERQVENFQDDMELSTLPRGRARDNNEFDRQCIAQLEKIGDIRSGWDRTNENNIERTVREISEIVAWAESNSNFLSEPSMEYNEAQIAFDQRSSNLLKYFRSKRLSRVGSAPKPTENEATLINSFNNEGVLPFLNQLQTRLETPRYYIETIEG
jgi:hypothetical protein